MAKRSKQKKCIQQTSCTKISSTLMPDYLEGVLTEPNDNPVIFHATHQRGEAMKPDYYVPKVYWSCFLAANILSMTNGLIAAGVYIGTTLFTTGLGLTDFISVLTGAIQEFGLKAVLKELAIASGPAAVATLIMAIGYMDAQTGYPYDKWIETIKEAQNQQNETFVWYERVGKKVIEHIDYKWEYLESHMEWIFETTSYTIVNNMWQQDNTGKYIQTVALSPVQTLGKNLSNAVTVSVYPYTILHATDIYKQKGGGSDKKIERRW